MEQVHDVLDFPYKFTRLIRSERVVVTAKQESMIKLSQCLLGDTESILFLVSEKKRWASRARAGGKWRKRKTAKRVCRISGISRWWTTVKNCKGFASVDNHRVCKYFAKHEFRNSATASFCCQSQKSQDLPWTRNLERHWNGEIVPSLLE